MKKGTFFKEGIRCVALFFLLATVPLSTAPFLLPSTASASGQIEVWWPKDGQTVSGTTQLKAILSGSRVEDYSMTWNVDGGGDTVMQNSEAEYPHKVSSLDFSGWTWKGKGPYAITLTARNQSGMELAKNTINIFVEQPNSSNNDSNNAPLPTKKQTISIWWPTDQTRVQGTIPLKAVLDGADVTAYKMFWQVDSKEKYEMPTNNNDWPHKEISVATSQWNWNNSNEYSLTFTATDLSGIVMATKTITVISTNQNTTLPPPPPQSQSITNPLANQKLFTGTYSPASTQVEQWMSSRPTDALLIKTLVGVQDARWFGSWNSDVEGDVRTYVDAAQSVAAMPVLVAYNIPFRDCGGFSAGGANDTTGYKNWIQSFAKGIGTKKAVVIVEPDALPGMECLPAAEQQTRLELLSFAVSTLKSNKNTIVYIDAGHSNWVSVPETARRLTKANIALADGFSLNVSNYYTNEQIRSFGDALSNAVGGKHYVVDTSRNGNGSNSEWCNPSGRAIGNLPTTNTGSSLIDAFLWIKKPGESDGYCNGGPAAGAWWDEYALGLLKNRR